MFHFWADGSTEAHDFSTILVGLFSEATQGAADPNELLRIARDIRSGNREDWTTAFLASAERTAAIAEAAEARGQRVTAATAYAHAFTYFRVAELMRPYDDHRKLPLYRRAIACFDRHLALAEVAVERITVPFDGHQLAGYYFAPRGRRPGERAPCVVFLSGADALPEQNYFRGVQWLTARGLGCFLINGPGQGGSIRLLGLPTIPDFERPVAAAVDVLVQRPDVDPARIGLLGVSMAGYYGMRAAAFEPRLKAVVAWGAMYSVYADLWVHYPPLRRQLMWITRSGSENEAIERLKHFTLEGVLGRVRCPALITHGVNDEMVPVASAERTFAELGSRDKELRLYTPADGGDTHINIDNWSVVVPVMADWLVDKLQ